MKRNAKQSCSGGRFRLAALLATAAAFLLVPASQAVAEHGEPHLTVNLISLEGGGGEVLSPSATKGFPGTPPLACTLPEGASEQEGTCENEMDGGEGEWVESMEGFPGPNSELVNWEVVSGIEWPGPEECEANKRCFVLSAGEDAEINVTFACEAGKECPEAPPVEGPPLKLTIEEGEGTVASNPAAAGFPCSGLAVTTCEAEFEEGKEVVLTASPAPGYLFKSWKKCDTGGVNGRQCTVTMSSPKEVGAKFVKSWDLTISKAAGSGPGIAKSKPGGIVCLYSCTTATAAFKEGKEVEVSVKPAKHFHFVEYLGGTGSAEGCTGAGECKFLPTADSAVEALFEEDDKNTLSLAKEGGGQGFVKTKPSGVLCGYTCSSAAAEYFFNEEVTVSVKLNKGTSSVEWTTGAGTCEGKVETLESTCTVPMGENESLVAKFE